MSHDSWWLLTQQVSFYLFWMQDHGVSKVEGVLGRSVKGDENLSQEMSKGPSSEEWYDPLYYAQILS